MMFPKLSALFECRPWQKYRVLHKSQEKNTSWFQVFGMKHVKTNAKHSNALNDLKYIHCLAKTWSYLTSHVCTEIIFDSRPFMYNKILLKKTLREVGSSHLYASFGTFWVQIGQLFEAQWVFEKCLKTVKSLFSKENVVDFGNLPNAQRLTVLRIIDQFGRKRCQKKRKVVNY